MQWPKTGRFSFPGLSPSSRRGTVFCDLGCFEPARTPLLPPGEFVTMYGIRKGAPGSQPCAPQSHACAPERGPIVTAEGWLERFMAPDLGSGGLSMVMSLLAAPRVRIPFPPPAMLQRIGTVSIAREGEFLDSRVIEG